MSSALTTTSLSSTGSPDSLVLSGLFVLILHCKYHQMGLLNSIVGWFMQERLERIQYFRKHPVQVQQGVLIELISQLAKTEYGRALGINKGSSPTEYRERLPIVGYSELRPLIERMMEGEENLLLPGEVNWYAKSSGTTSARSKFIPIPKASLEECHFKAGKDMYALYYKMNPQAELATGRILVVGGSHTVHKHNEHAQFGDLSAVLVQNLPFWAEMLRVPSLEIALMDNWEEKVNRMAEASIRHSITNVLGVPTWTAVLFQRILEITGKSTIKEVWPNLELYVHGGVSFVPYRELFRELIGSDDICYLQTYNASEGYFGLQEEYDDEDMLLMLDYGIYYEFIPWMQADKENPDILQLQDVQVGEKYALLISTNGGLWRYLIGDTITFTSTSPYKIIVSGRTTSYINAFGEELIVDNADRAIARACEATGASITDYLAAPKFLQAGKAGAHEWLIEFSKQPSDAAKFNQLLDQELQDINSDYAAKRVGGMALAEPVVHNVPPLTFHNWLKKQGKLGGQHKIPRLCNDRSLIDQLLKEVYADEDLKVRAE